MGAKMESSEFNSWKEEREKDRVLALIEERGTLDILQISDSLGKSPEDTRKTIQKLQEQNLVQSKAGNIYQLTFEGYKRARMLRSQQSNQRAY
jgi:Mn-dependent DtxR family transcriptional regulator